VILTENSMTEIERKRHPCKEPSELKDLGPLKYFLGLEVARYSKGTPLCQRNYTLDILSETWMLDCKPSQTPLMHNTKILYDKVEPVKDPDSYRHLIGKLLYLTNSRPDICYFVHLLSQFVQTPTIYHHQAAQHILRYIRQAQLMAFSFLLPTTFKSRPSATQTRLLALIHDKT